MTETRMAIERFLEALETGDWNGMEGLVTAGALYDGSMPGWRTQLEGAARIVQEYREEWTGKHTWRVVERETMPTPDGAVVTIEIHGRCPGDEHHAGHEEVCRIANVFRLEGDRIAEHRYWCCGEWDEETLARIEAEAPKVSRAARAR